MWFHVFLQEAQLRDEGHQIGRYKVRRLMRELGLKAKAPKRYKVTTDSRHSFPVAANLLDRKFDVDKPNTVWTTDITYVWTLEGWLYYPWCLIFTPAKSLAGRWISE
jgi:putative transposase